MLIRSDFISVWDNFLPSEKMCSRAARASPGGVASVGELTAVCWWKTGWTRRTKREAARCKQQ